MNETLSGDPEQTELGLSAPEVPPVTSEIDSASIKAVPKPIEGGSGMGEESNNKGSGQIEELDDHQLATEMASLLGSQAPEDRARLDAVKGVLRRRIEQQSGMFPPEPSPSSDEHEKRMKELDEFYRRRGGPSNVPKNERPEY